MIIEWKVESVSDIVTVWVKHTEKRSIIVVEHAYEWKHPNSLMIDFMGDKIRHLDEIEVGDVVRLHYSTRCNENNGRIYNNIKWYFIEVLQTA